MPSSAPLPREPLEQLTRAEMAGLSDEELEDYTWARMVFGTNPILLGVGATTRPP